MDGTIHVTGRQNINKITITDAIRNPEEDSDDDDGDADFRESSPESIMFAPDVHDTWMTFSGLRVLHVDMHKLSPYRWTTNETEPSVLLSHGTLTLMLFAALYKAPWLTEFVGYFSRIHDLINMSGELPDAMLQVAQQRQTPLCRFRLLCTGRHLRTKKVFMPLFRGLLNAFFCVTHVVTQNVSDSQIPYHIYYAEDSWRALVGCGSLRELRLEITGCTQDRSRVGPTGLCILPLNDVLWIDDSAAAQPSSQPVPACVQAEYLSIGTLTIPAERPNSWPDDYMKKVLMSIFKNPNNRFLSFALLSGSFCGNRLCVRPENDGHFHIPSIDTIELPSRTVLIHVFGMRRDIHSRAINSVTNDLHNFINKCDTLLMTFTSPKPDPDRPDYPGQ
jgi:hypothetical protein